MCNLKLQNPILQIILFLNHKETEFLPQTQMLLLHVATWVCKPLFFQTLTIWSEFFNWNISTSGYKDMGIKNQSLLSKLCK